IADLGLVERRHDLRAGADAIPQPTSELGVRAAMSLLVRLGSQVEHEMHAEPELRPGPEPVAVDELMVLDPRVEKHQLGADDRAVRSTVGLAEERAVLEVPGGPLAVQTAGVELAEQLEHIRGSTGRSPDQDRRYDRRTYHHHRIVA